MCGISESRTQLPLASMAHQGCGCCSPAAETRAAESADRQPAVQESEAQYTLVGLTCGHCVRTVEQAVTGVAGVESATVDLVPGGNSRLRVKGAAGREALAEAVRAAGYSMVNAN